jgi:glycosyltransferase involved in cell wall biosynthesis
MQYMLPSKVYTFMASGRPLIAAIDRTSDLAETIRAVDCGRVVDPGDVGAVERELRWLHANPLAGVQMGQRGRRAAEERFSIEVGPARYRELVERLR